jgi:multidrug efflux pump subunit AcrA (membrane-fusion protein)
MELIPFSISKDSLETYFIKITTRSRIIYWIIISTVIIGIVILPFVYVDVSVQAQGFFQTYIEKQIIYAPFQGKISFTSITSGSEVLKGDTLLVIYSETIIAQKYALEQKLDENEAFIADLTRLTELDTINGNPYLANLSTKKYKAEYANLKNQQASQLQKLRKRNSEHVRNEFLYKQEIIPCSEYETASSCS